MTQSHPPLPCIARALFILFICTNLVYTNLLEYLEYLEKLKYPSSQTKQSAPRVWSKQVTCPVSLCTAQHLAQGHS